MTLDDVLDRLDRHRIRATYAAVGQAIGTTAAGVGTILKHRPRTQWTSWVVRIADGEPYGYGDKPEHLHPRLFSSPKIFRTGEEIKRLCG